MLEPNLHRTCHRQFDVWIDQIHCQTAEDIWEMIAISMEQATIFGLLFSK
jgi:hypothetical protein